MEVWVGRRLSSSVNGTLEVSDDVYVTRESWRSFTCKTIVDKMKAERGDVYDKTIMGECARERERNLEVIDLTQCCGFIWEYRVCEGTLSRDSSTIIDDMKSLSVRFIAGCRLDVGIVVCSGRDLYTCRWLGVYGGRGVCDLYYVLVLGEILSKVGKDGYKRFEELLSMRWVVYLWMTRDILGSGGTVKVHMGTWVVWGEQLVCYVSEGATLERVF
ncbi:hypothetical protein Tco_0878228 [Tanacetum coccineum]|uniref:Uncharacterized protein n=1 Tax=Tanacetum coccineum TaxID=301880 RepID=A0ABQ5BZS8_9ASTR